jgi:hypothetical protein
MCQIPPFVKHGSRVSRPSNPCTMQRKLLLASRVGWWIGSLGRESVKYSSYIKTAQRVVLLDR